MPRLLLLLASAALSRGAITPNAPECWGTEDRYRSFSGSMTTNGGEVVEQIGRRGSERVLQKKYGELRVCMVTQGFDGEPDDPPGRWTLRSDRVILETRMPDDLRSLEVNEGRVIYRVNGAEQPLDDAAQEWRDNLLALLDPTWDLAQLRGRLSSLHGAISSIQGERSSLEGRISSLRGRVSSMQGEISTIRGHESSLRGEIASERAAIPSPRHEDNIRRLERQIREFDADARVREVERRIDEFDVETKVARLRRVLDGLGVDERVDRIEEEIRVLDEPARSRELEERRDEALATLKRTLGVPH
jgi:chromosome segregation ATPase